MLVNVPHGLILLALLLLPFPRTLTNTIRGRSIAFLVFIALCLPVHGIAITGYFRGIFHDPSIPTYALAFIALVSRLAGIKLANNLSINYLAIFCIGSGLLLYPFSLGLSSIDPYRWGFGAAWFTGAIITLAFVAWQSRNYFLPIALSLGIIAHSFGLLQSSNLWDYLTDPLVFCYSLIRIGNCALSKLKGKTTRAEGAPPRVNSPDFGIANALISKDSVHMASHTEKQPQA